MKKDRNDIKKLNNWQKRIEKQRKLLKERSKKEKFFSLKVHVCRA